MNEEEISGSEKLEFLTEKVVKFGVQGLPNYQFNLALVQCLQNSIAGLEWAQNPITQCADIGISWYIHKFLTAFDAALLHNE